MRCIHNDKIHDIYNNPVTDKILSNVIMNDFFSKNNCICSKKLLKTKK